MNTSDINHLRIQSSCYNLSNLYDLSISLSPYIKELDLNSLNIKSGEIKCFSGTASLNICKPINNTTYYIQDPMNNKANILMSTNMSVDIDLSFLDNTNYKCELNCPSGKITIKNGLCYPGECKTFIFNNSFIKQNSNILLTINKFYYFSQLGKEEDKFNNPEKDKASIPVCIVNNIISNSCEISIYNAGINVFPESYDIAFLIM